MNTRKTLTEDLPSRKLSLRKPSFNAAQKTTLAMTIPSLLA